MHLVPNYTQGPSFTVYIGSAKHKPTKIVLTHIFQDEQPSWCFHRNDSETSLPPDDSIEIIESDNEAEIIEESEKPEDDTQDVVMIEDDQSVPADTTECFAPRGFDEHGHPLDERKIRQNHQVCLCSG